MSVYDLSPAQLRAMIAYKRRAKMSAALKPVTKINVTMMTANALWRRGYIEPINITAPPTKSCEFQLSSFGGVVLSHIKSLVS